MDEYIPVAYKNYWFHILLDISISNYQLYQRVHWTYHSPIISLNPMTINPKWFVSWNQEIIAGNTSYASHNIIEDLFVTLTAQVRWINFHLRYRHPHKSCYHIRCTFAWVIPIECVTNWCTCSSEDCLVLRKSNACSAVNWLLGPGDKR